MINGDIWSEYVNGAVFPAAGDGVYSWGNIKNIKLYRGVVTASEAAANFNSCTGTPAATTASLLLWAKIDEGSGYAITDYSSYNKTGDVVRLRWYGGAGDAVAPSCLVVNESVLCKTRTVTQAVVQGYRYGFNGKENDNEVKGEGNQQDYGMRIYDARLGRFLSVDPIYKQYPELTPYQFASNTPIQAIDLDGLEAKEVFQVFNPAGEEIYRLDKCK